MGGCFGTAGGDAVKGGWQLLFCIFGHESLNQLVTSFPQVLQINLKLVFPLPFKESPKRSEVE